MEPGCVVRLNAHIKKDRPVKVDPCHYYYITSFSAFTIVILEPPDGFIAVTRKQVCEAMGSNWVISKEGRVCADDQDADEWDYKIRCYREFRKAGIL